MAVNGADQPVSSVSKIQDGKPDPAQLTDQLKALAEKLQLQGAAGGEQEDNAAFDEEGLLVPLQQRPAMSDQDERAMYAVMDRAEAIAEATGLDPETAMQQARAEQRQLRKQKQLPQTNGLRDAQPDVTAVASAGDNSIASRTAEHAAGIEKNTMTSMLQQPDQAQVNSSTATVCVQGDRHRQEVGVASKQQRPKHSSAQGLKRGFFGARPKQKAVDQSKPDAAEHAHASRAASPSTAAVPSFTGAVIERGTNFSSPSRVGNGDDGLGPTEGVGKPEQMQSPAGLDQQTEAGSDQRSPAGSGQTGVAEKTNLEPQMQKRVSRFRAARAGQA